MNIRRPRGGACFRVLLPVLAALVAAPFIRAIETVPSPFTARFENDAEGLWLVYPTVPGWHYRIESSPTPATEEGVNEFEFVPGSFRYGNGQEQRWWLAPAPPPAVPPDPPPPARTFFTATLHLHISSDTSPPQVEVVRKDFDGEVLWKRHLPFSRIQNAVFSAVHQSDAATPNRGVKTAGLRVTLNTDGGTVNNGNVRGYTPIRACLTEVEYLSNATALALLKGGQGATGPSNLRHSCQKRNIGGSERQAMKTQHIIAQAFAGVWFLCSCSPETDNTAPAVSKKTIPPLSSETPCGHQQPEKPQRSFEETRDLGHAGGRSRELYDSLHLPVPDWLHIGPPVTGKVVNQAPVLKSFRDPTGGVKRTTTHAYLTTSGLRYSPQKGYLSSASLSPSGKKLAVSVGTEGTVYKVLQDNVEQTPEAELPAVNFGEERRWFINKWSWLSEDRLIGVSSEEDAHGYDYAETRLYLYDVRDGMLARIRLPEGLGISPRQHIKLAGLDPETSQLLIETTVDGTKKEFVIQLDLHDK